MQRSADEHGGNGPDGSGSGCVDRGPPRGRPNDDRHLVATAGSKLRAQARDERHAAFSAARLHTELAGRLGKRTMPIAGGPPVLETATRPTSSVTSGSKAYGRTFAPLARPRSTARLTKSAATTRQSCCYRWKSAASNENGSTRPQAFRVGRGIELALVAQNIQRVLQIRRIGADDLHLPPIAGMSERQRSGV